MALLLSVAPAAAQDFAFSRVTVEGSERSDDQTVLSFAQIPQGQPISAAALNDALQRILASGLYETAELEPRGGTLVIRVREWPTINRISIEGNRRIDDEALLAQLQSQPRRIYTPSIAEADASLIVSAYEQAGRFAATVSPSIIRRSDNRVDLVFEVAEGRVVEIERIGFVGNRAFSESRLRRVLATKQAGFLRQVIQRDTFLAPRIAFDETVLRDFYASRGYIDFEVLNVATEFTRARDATFITFTLREGPRWSFGAISASSQVDGIDAARFGNEARMRTGQFYTPLLVEETITRMERLALNDGLDFIRVEPRLTRNPETLTIDIDFEIIRGARVFVERIDIEGNQTTLDRVIRREFTAAEGDPFNPREIRRTAERIRALGFFASADVNTRQGSRSDQVIVDVDVEEQPTGSFGFGGTFSVSSGFGLALNFAESNFLGRGQTLRFDLNTTGSNSQSQITFVEPSFLARDVRFSFQAFLNSTELDSSFFSTRVAGARTSLRFPIGDLSNLELSYALSADEIFDVSADSSIIIQAEAGELLTSVIGYRYTYDTRRDGLNPRGGILLSFGQDFAGLGGDNRFIKTTGRALAQTTVLNDEITLRATLEGGTLTMLEGDSRVTDRFFLSSTQLRGFEFRGLGPRDQGAVNNDALGGNMFAVARFEADFPLGLPEEYGISGGVFLDVGTLWGLDNVNGTTGLIDDGAELRSSIGFSLFWNTPIGPLTFNFSRILEKQPFDEEQLFDFSITTRF